MLFYTISLLVNFLLGKLILLHLSTLLAGTLGTKADSSRMASPVSTPTSVQGSSVPHCQSPVGVTVTCSLPVAPHDSPPALASLLFGLLP